MATRSVSADEGAATRAIRRELLGKLNLRADGELSSEAVEWAAAEIRKQDDLNERQKAVLFKFAVTIARVFARYEPQLPITRRVGRPKAGHLHAQFCEPCRNVAVWTFTDLLKPATMCAS